MDPSQYYPQQPQLQPSYKPPKNSKGLVVGLGLSAALFLGLFVWQFVQASQIRSNAQAEQDRAVAAANEELQEKLQAEFKTTLESDTSNFVGPDVLGRVTFTYPKTWSVFVETKGTNSIPLDVTMHPNAITDTTPAFALRVQVIEEAYAEQVAEYNRSVEKGELTAKPVTYSEQNGIRFDGLLEDDVQGSVVLLPLRDKTLLLQTESNNYQQVFTAILTSLNYVP